MATKEAGRIYQGFMSAWEASGNTKKPAVQLSFWYGLHGDADARVKAFARDYLKIFGDEFADSTSSRCCATSPAAIRDILKRLEDLGYDEVILAPTTADLDELSATEDLVSSL